MMAGSNTLRSKGRIQMSETGHPQISHIQLPNARSVHTEVPMAEMPCQFGFLAGSAPGTPGGKLNSMQGSVEGLTRWERCSGKTWLRRQLSKDLPKRG